MFFYYSASGLVGNNSKANLLHNLEGGEGGVHFRSNYVFILSLVVSTSRPIEIEIENVLSIETNF